MRKTSFIRYIVLTAVAVTAVSCSLHESGLDQPGSLSLDFKCSDLLTRADDDPETAIESIDYFLYTSETGAAVYHNRISTTSTTAVLDNVADLKEVGKSCYVYAVANLPSDVTISGTETVAQLQSISVTTDFTSAQTSFVMDSKEVVSATVGSSVTVPLQRLAAKMTMTVNIPSSIVVGASGESAGTTYVPDYQHLRIYFVNAAKKGAFDGSYMTYGNTESEEGNKANYFIYPYDWAISVTDGAEGKHVGTSVTPFYTYPQSWEPEEVHEPYFKVILPWAASGDASNSKPYYYKVVIPNDFNGKIDRNTFYKFVMDIGVLGSEVDDGSVEISGDYYVVDWSKAFTVGGDDGGDALTKGKYLSVSQSEYSIYAENGITIPVTSSHNLSVSNVSCTYTDYSTDPAKEKTLDAGYTVTPNGRNSVILTHNLSSDINSSDLDCSIYEFTITIANEAGCNPVTVKVKQYPSLYISIEKSNKTVFINNNRNNITEYRRILDDGVQSDYVENSHTFNLRNNDISYEYDGINVSFSNVTYNSKYGAKEFGDNRNDGIMTITAPEGKLISALNISYYKSDQSVTYSPSAEGSTENSWKGSPTPTLTVTMAHANNNRNVVKEIVVKYAGPGLLRETLGSLRPENSTASSNNNNFNIYTINVSNLTGNSSGWYIADPRLTIPESIPQLKGGGSESLDGYLPVDPAKSGAIAPQFKVASSSGASMTVSRNGVVIVDGGMTYDQAKRRCASYQENGYPAGRWRMPTDAEIRFMISLNKIGKIPSLYDGAYWAASGSILDSDGVIITDERTQSSVRCVYDSWYWGDEPMSQYMTTWSGWQTD